MILRSSTNQIECAFGRLKARGRIFMRPMDITVSHLPTVIFACFVLHNFSERKNVDVDKQVVEQVIQEERCGIIKVDKLNCYTTPIGTQVRNSVKTYL